MHAAENMRSCANNLVKLYPSGRHARYSLQTVGFEGDIHTKRDISYGNEV